MSSLVLEPLSRELSENRLRYQWSYTMRHKLRYKATVLPACLSSVAAAVILWLLSAYPPVYADNHVQPYRFAVVNMSAILKRAPQSAAESEQLEERFANRERALAVKQEELRRADEAFGRERSNLSAEELVQRESELRAFQRRLKREREDLREEVRISKDRALNRLQTKVAEAIEAIRQREAIDIIFRESDYIVASERMDVTDKVLEELQQQFESGQANTNDTRDTSTGQDVTGSNNAAQDAAQENTAAGE